MREITVSSYPAWKIKDVLVTQENTLFITECGEIFECGKPNSDFTLTVEAREEACWLLPRFVTSSVNGKKIMTGAVGSSHIALLSNEHQLHLAGEGAYGQLGNNDFHSHQAPLPLTAFNHVNQVSCGSSQTMFTTTDGKVFVCGANSHGALGLGHTETQYKPVQVPALSQMFIRKVCRSSGSQGTFFLTKEGKVFACGSNMGGALGLPDSDSDVYIIIPQPLITLAHEHIVDVALGMNNTLFLTKTGKVYSHSGLTLGYSPASSGDQPLPPFSGSPIKQIAVGNFHTLFLTEHGQVYSSGSSPASGHLDDNDLPRLLISLARYIIKRIIAGPDCSFFITQDGDVYSCGEGSNGQLGLGHKNDVVVPSKINTINISLM